MRIPSLLVAGAASPVATETLTCADFALAAAHLTSRTHILAINDGTTNDNVPVLGSSTRPLPCLPPWHRSARPRRSTWKALKINRSGRDGI